MTDTALPDLIQQMLQPGFYLHPVKEPVQLIQTHISYIFLTGDFAYKVKKPMDFGFLNFTTLEQRHHFCLEELRMNERGAPGVYLEVLPISQQGDRFQLDGSGPVVEYTLKMRQFPQDALFSSLFDRGELTEQHLEALGRTVAAFHIQAPTSDYVASFGTIAKIREAFDQNYEQTEKYIGGPQTLVQFAETRAYTDRFFAERTELLNQRREQGWIRECHGDLHLRNICLWNGKILLFDCIEFNEDFRLVDVMFDVAYAVMDLDARHRSDLANAYLNTYVEQTGDWEGLQVLPIYLNRQAYVRAKVTSFLLDDPTAPLSVKTEAEKTAAGYYHLAWKYTQPQQGRLILMSGLSGSGKSTVARHLARRLGAIHIRSDAVRKHLAGIPLYERGEPSVYSPAMTHKTYERLMDLGMLLAAEGYCVILDAKYDRQDFRAAVFQQAQAQQIPVQIVHCTAPLEVLQERVHRRSSAGRDQEEKTSGGISWEIAASRYSPDIADATVDLLTKQQANWVPFSPDEIPYVLTLDTQHDWIESLRQLIP